MDKSIRKFRKSELDIEIKITLWKIDNLTRKLDDNFTRLETRIVPVVIQEFRLRVKKRYDNIFKTVKSKNLKKITKKEVNNLTISIQRTAIFSTM